MGRAYYDAAVTSFLDENPLTIFGKLADQCSGPIKLDTF
jgi:hypothetical protein